MAISLFAVTYCLRYQKAPPFEDGGFRASLGDALGPKTMQFSNTSGTMPMGGEQAIME